MGKRLISIDIARAICIILVVVGHYAPTNSPEWYLTLNRIIYSFHMPLFMFVSGYVYWATKKEAFNYTDFIWKKFKRLMAPYFFVSILIIVIKLVTEKGLYLESPISFSAFYEMFYYPAAGFFLWFAYCLFLIFAIIPFFSSQKSILILFLFSLVLYIIPIKLPDLFCLPQLKNNLVYFTLGCLVFKLVSVRKLAGNIHYIILVVLFVISYYLKSTLTVESDLFKKIINLYLALLGVLTVSNFSRKIQHINISWLLSISGASYTIYLLHTTFSGFAKAVLFKLPLEQLLGNSLSFIFSMIIVVVIGVLIPLLLHKIIEKKSSVLSFLLGINCLVKR